MKKIFACILFIFICSITLQAKNPNELTVWLLGNSGPGVKNALPDFNKKYPNIDVNLQVFGWNDLMPKLQAALTAGSGAPDVVEIFTNTMPRFLGTGAFMPINKQVEPFLNDIASFGMLETNDAAGNIYGLSWSASPNLLFYRSDILEAEGVDPASLKTWEDLIKVGKKVTHNNQYMFLTASQATYPQYWNYFTGMLSQLGGSPFDINGNISINNNDNALKVLKTMDAINKAKISLDVDSWWTPAFGAALKSGKLASFVTGAFHVSILKKTAPEASGLWRIQLAPTIAGGHKSGLFAGGARTVAITSQSENQNAAWNFIQYMMLDENGIQATWEGGAIIPSYNPIFGATYFDDPDPYYGNQNVGRIIMNGLATLDGQEWNSGPIPSGMMSNEIVGSQLRSLMTNKITPEEGVDKILEGMGNNMP